MDRYSSICLWTSELPLLSLSLNIFQTSFPLRQAHSHLSNTCYSLGNRVPTLSRYEYQWLFAIKLKASTCYLLSRLRTDFTLHTIKISKMRFCFVLFCFPSSSAIDMLFWICRLQRWVFFTPLSPPNCPNFYSMHEALVLWIGVLSLWIEARLYGFFFIWYMKRREGV